MAGRKNFPHRKKLRKERADARKEASDLKINDRGNYNGEEVISFLLKKADKEKK